MTDDFLWSRKFDVIPNDSASSTQILIFQWFQKIMLFQQE